MMVRFGTASLAAKMTVLETIESKGRNCTYINNPGL